MRGCYVCGQKPAPYFFSTPDTDYELCKFHGAETARQLTEKRHDQWIHEEQVKTLARMLRTASRLQAEDPPQG